jgi:hypothetical protein
MMDQKKIPPPVFKGKTGEDPASHILKANDWMDAEGTPVARKCQDFRYTLADEARQWYDDITIPATWDELQRMFANHYSKQGRSPAQLHAKWKSLAFNPATDSVESFIRDVKQTARQLGFGDAAVVNCIKGCVPQSVAIAMYPLHDLGQITQMLSDIYPPPVTGSTASTSQGGATPFSMHEVKGSPEGSKNPHKNERVQVTSTEESTLFRAAVERFGKAVSNWNRGSKGKPYKPSVSPPARRGGYQGKITGGRYVPLGPNSNRYPRANPRNFKNNVRGYRGPNRGFRRGNRPFNRPPQRSSPRDRDRDRCYKCQETGHWARDCPSNRDSSSQNSTSDNRDYSLMSDPQDQAQALPPYYYLN